MTLLDVGKEFCQDVTTLDCLTASIRGVSKVFLMVFQCLV